MGFTKKQKQNRNILVGIAIIVGAIILINIGGGNFFAVAGVPSDLTYEQCSVAGGGITTLSASNFQITDPTGTKERIRVNLVASGSECLDVRLRASDLDNSLRNLGMDATKDIVVSAKYEEFSTTFPIKTESSLLKTNYQNTVVSNSRSNLARIDFCQSKGYTDVIYAYKPAPLTDVRCVRAVGGTQWGQFTGASNDNFKVTFVIGDSSPVTLTRSKSSDVTDSGSTNVGEHYVQWVGGLSSADRINVPDSYDLWKVGTGWQLATDGLPSAVNNVKDDFVTCMGQYGNQFSDSRFDSCKNSAFINGLASEVFLQQDLDIPEVNDWSLTTGALYITTTARPFQQFILDLDAESVGIVKLQGKPEITSCIQDNLRLESGINKPVSFQVKNDANVNNVKFEGGVECNQGVSATFPSFQINAMETKTINTQLISNNPNIADLNYDCTLTVRDLSGVQDTCGFDGKVEFTSGIIGGCQSDSDCSSGQQCKFGNCVTPSITDTTQCISEGQTFSKDQECCAGLEKKKTGFFLFRFLKSEGTCEIKLPKCADADAFVRSKVLGDIFPKLKCDGTLFQKINPLAYIKLILVPIVFLFELLFTPAMIGRYFKRGKGFAWLIGLILAGIVAYTLYTAFLMGLIFVGILFFFQITAGVISLFKKK